MSEEEEEGIDYEEMFEALRMFASQVHVLAHGVGNLYGIADAIVRDNTIDGAVRRKALKARNRIMEGVDLDALQTAVLAAQEAVFTWRTLMEASAQERANAQEEEELL